MCRHIGWISLSLLILAASFGCTIAPKPTVEQKEDLLVAAGFRYKTAETPEQMERLKKLPQEKLILRKIKGKTYYLFAEAARCKCLYRGDEAAYARYQELAREQKAASKIEMYEQQDEDRFPPMDDWAGLLDD